MGDGGGGGRQEGWRRIQLGAQASLSGCCPPPGVSPCPCHCCWLVGSVLSSCIMWPSSSILTVGPATAASSRLMLCAADMMAPRLVAASCCSMSWQGEGGRRGKG